MASKAEGEGETMVTDVDLGGTMRAHVRKTKTVPMPADTEQLRTRFKRLENGLLYLQTKYCAKAWLQDIK